MSRPGSVSCAATNGEGRRVGRAHGGDGRPTCGKLSTNGEIVSAALARNRRMGARIHTVAIGAASEELLRALARQTDGDFTE